LAGTKKRYRDSELLSSERERRNTLLKGRRIEEK